MRKLKKKGQITAGVSGLVTIVIILVVAGIVAVFGLDVMDTVDDDFTANTYPANASLDTQEGIANISAKFPLLGTIVIVGVILAALAGFLVFRAGR